MSNIETTEMKLRTTPTGGLSGEHSPYYRRLLSAGYKGFLQGTIGGSGLYGVMGLAVGALVAVPAMILVPPLGASALMLIPLMGGAGIIKGASTFGNIGSVAAINAESADLAEQRRYLLDRYYELPEGPEGDKQAEIIKQELTRQHTSMKPEHMFHMKTVLIGAAIGAAVILGFLTIGLPLLPSAAVAAAIPEVMHGLTIGGAHLIVGGEIAPIFGVIGTAIGTAIGAATGAMIGLDRYYVRKWFDVSENMIYDKSHARDALLVRERQVERLSDAARADDETKKVLERTGEIRNYERTPDVAQAIAPSSVASLEKMPEPQAPEKPINKVSSGTVEKRMASLQQALASPAV